MDEKWTIDKMIGVTTDVYRDLNLNGAKDESDLCCLTLTDFHNDAFDTGSRLKLLEKDFYTIVRIYEYFYGEKTIDLLVKIGSYDQTNDVYNDALQNVQTWLSKTQAQRKNLNIITMILLQLSNKQN